MTEEAANRRTSRRLRAVVYGTLFVTGAATLALEVVASRTLTPYVGGGLTVWTAILSVTLLALAGGYHLGSRASAREPRRRFIGAPVLAAMALAMTAAAAPILLPLLTEIPALPAAFLGATTALAPSLVLLSAMGPLAVALVRTEGGDGGAGEAFAVSTVGSVVGVYVAAFLLLPFMPPTAAITAVAVGLALISAVAAIGLGTARAAAVPLVVAVATLAFAPSGGGDALVNGDVMIRRVATERSPQATVVVADLERAGFPGRVRVYLEEGQPQSAVATEIEGNPLRYATVANAIIEATTAPGAHVLALGLAGGAGVSELARSGYAVHAVDVNPAAPEIARRWFDLAPGVEVTVEDARRHVVRCRRRYAAALVDVYSGAEIPDHLVTREFFAALADCLEPDGAIVVNAVAPPVDTRPTRRLISALAAATGSSVGVYEEDREDAGRANRLLLARKGGGEFPTLSIARYPETFFEREARVFEPRVVTADDLADVAPLTDWSNDFALSLALSSPVPKGSAIPLHWR